MEGNPPDHRGAHRQPATQPAKGDRAKRTRHRLPPLPRRQTRRMGETPVGRMAAIHRHMRPRTIRTPVQQAQGRIHRPGRRWRRTMGRETLRSRKTRRRGQHPRTPRLSAHPRQHRPVRRGKQHDHRLENHRPHHNSQRPSQQYRIQASLYGIGLENDGEPCKRNAIYFLPRNSVSLADALPIEFDFDPKPGRWALSRAQLIANLLDLIEQEDGTEMRDAWIHALPTSPTHCFQCGSWPDDQLGQLSELNENQYPALPDKWRQAIGLLESTYRKTER